MVRTVSSCLLEPSPRTCLHVDVVLDEHQHTRSQYVVTVGSERHLFNMPKPEIRRSPYEKGAYFVGNQVWKVRLIQRQHSCKSHATTDLL